ncbi:hypothetical protein HQ37_07410 [Porphyromonas sp. COT-239 OH1446]|nr:hypothetical protein HQ37_07410 [Porphyromonas sp. COT-239 OH1446]
MYLWILYILKDNLIFCFILWTGVEILALFVCFPCNITLLRGGYDRFFYILTEKLPPLFRSYSFG